jgi:NAD(P)-dependent dehydrogenase (short-subunit alcohol dehydrogenase family)
MGADLKGKVAVVTGGSSGIGRAAALAFAREGARVLIAARRETEGEETVRRIRAGGGEGTFVRTDVTREEDIAALVARAMQAYGRLDFAFNNAGVEGSTMAPLAEQPVANYDTIFNPNVRGVFLSLKYEIPAMLKGGGGAIVNNASVAGLVGFPGVSLYVASKHAVIGLTKAAALEYAKSGIRVNAVAPGAIESEMLDRFTQQVPREALAAMHPVGRTGKAEEIADAVVWLCSPQASFVTGQTLAIDGGFTVQ